MTIYDGRFGQTIQALPPKIDATLRIVAVGDGLTPLIDKLALVTRDRSALQAVLRRAITKSFLLNLRNRFLERLRHALEMRVLFSNGEQQLDDAVQRLNREKTRKRLERLYEALGEAEIDGDTSRAQRLRSTSIPAARDSLVRMLQTDANTGNRKSSHQLAKLNGVTTMRRLALSLLENMTSVSQLGVHADENSLTVGIGNVAALSDFETPSATPNLTGQATQSKYRMLWRHLEFGTGVYRKDAKNAAGSRQGNPGPYGPGRFGANGGTYRGLSVRQGAPPRAWFYGRSIERGLLLAGTRPMNFLLNRDGSPFPEDWTTFESQFYLEMEQLLKL